MPEQFELGQFVRKRYIKQIPLLSQRYNRSEVYVRSTDFNRTIMSAQIHAVGLYAGSGKRNVDYPDIPGWPRDYVAVPVHVLPTNIDTVNIPGQSCPRVRFLEGLTESTPEMNALREDSQVFLARLSQHMGINVTLSGIGALLTSPQIDSLQIEVENKLPVASWVHQLLPQAENISHSRMRIAVGLGLLQSNDTLATEIAKVRGGLILWEIIDRFMAKQACTEKCAGQSACTCWPSKLKYYLYSSHYGVLMGLIASLGFDKIDVDRDVLPPDSSTFFFELWRRPAGEFYVKVMYRREQKLMDITSRVNGKECELSSFIQRSEKYKPLPSIPQCLRKW